MKVPGILRFVLITKKSRKLLCLLLPEILGVQHWFLPTLPKSLPENIYYLKINIYFCTRFRAAIVRTRTRITSPESWKCANSIWTTVATSVTSVFTCTTIFRVNISIRPAWRVTWENIVNLATENWTKFNELFLRRYLHFLNLGRSQWFQNFGNSRISFLFLKKFLWNPCSTQIFHSRSWTRCSATIGK